MLVRIAFGLGLAALGYYVGREIGRNESVRDEIARGDGPPGEDTAESEPGRASASQTDADEGRRVSG